MINGICFMCVFQYYDLLNIAYLFCSSETMEKERINKRQIGFEGGMSIFPSIYIAGQKNGRSVIVVFINDMYNYISTRTVFVLMLFVKLSM